MGHTSLKKRNYSLANAKTMMSPKGTAVYPRIKTADTKFDELGIYKADIAVDAADAADLMNRLQEVHKAHTGKPANASDNPMWARETDSEGVETGRIVFKFRVKNRVTKAGKFWDRQPVVFDAKGHRIMDIPNIGGGSVLKVNFEVYEWISGTKKGVSLQPQKVQLIDLVEFGGSDSNPFEEEEGFTIDTSDENQPELPFETFDDGGDDQEDF